MKIGAGSRPGSAKVRSFSSTNNADRPGGKRGKTGGAKTTGEDDDDEDDGSINSMLTDTDA